MNRAQIYAYFPGRILGGKKEKSKENYLFSLSKRKKINEFTVVQVEAMNLIPLLTEPRHIIKHLRFLLSKFHVS